MEVGNGDREEDEETEREAHQGRLKPWVFSTDKTKISKKKKQHFRSCA